MKRREFITLLGGAAAAWPLASSPLTSVFRLTRFEFVLNLKTAKVLGIDVPPGLAAMADEVIE